MIIWGSSSTREREERTWGEANELCLQGYLNQAHFSVRHQERWETTLKMNEENMEIKSLVIQAQLQDETKKRDWETCRGDMRIMRNDYLRKSNAWSSKSYMMRSWDCKQGTWKDHQEWKWSWDEEKWTWREEEEISSCKYSWDCQWEI